MDPVDCAILEAMAEGVFPGAVVLIRRNGHTLKSRAYGYSALYRDCATRLEDPIPARVDTIYDLASVTKLFVATAAMRLWERGELDLDAPVQEYLPEYRGRSVPFSARHLLTHTAGFTAHVPYYTMGSTPAERLAVLLGTVPESPPGTRCLYSDVGMMLLGVVLERLRGQPLEQIVAHEVLRPLGLRDTGYCPVGGAVRGCVISCPPVHSGPRAGAEGETTQGGAGAVMRRPEAEIVVSGGGGPDGREDRRRGRELARIAPTEYAAEGRADMVWGEVHDGNAWGLGGVAGHAGLFGTAEDVARFGQMFLEEGQGVLRPGTVAEMVRHQTPGMEARGLGFDLDSPSYMGGLAGPRTFGHTGFTGTSLVVEPVRRLVVVLLSNRVHPTRNGPAVNPVRAQVHTAALRLCG